MKKIVFFMLTLISCNSKESSDTFIMPGEFEAQEAVWLGWQGNELYYPYNKAMVEALLPYVNVKVVTESDSVLQVAKDYLLDHAVDTTSIQFYVIPDNEFWIRDHGATYTVNHNGAIRAVNFEWAMYGYRQWLIEKYNGNIAKADTVLSKTQTISKRGKVDSLMAVAENIPVISSWIKIEGGAIESNGRGTLILSEPLTMSRNEGVSKDSIEHEFKRVLGVQNIIWLQEGLAEDPHLWQTITGKYVGLGTGGHTDEFVRFADANTILLAWIPEEEIAANPLNAINYERMKVNFEILSNAVNEKGELFNIIKVPLPDLMSNPIKIMEAGNWEASSNIPISAFSEKDGWHVGDTAFRVASASYLNFYVTNGMVMLPSYITHGTSINKEEEVKRLFQQAFPDRDLVFLDAMGLNWEGGGLHCGTQQQPKAK